MNQRVKEKWCAALESDRFKQAQGCLQNHEAYCCLGVLCELHREEHPETRWEIINGYYRYLGQTDILPETVRVWAGLNERNPIVKDENRPDCPLTSSLSNLNDSGVDFKQIAQVIKEQL